MPVTLSERVAIEKMMSYVEGERTRLWEEYVKLLDRLRELDDIERPLAVVQAPEVVEPKKEVVSVFDLFTTEREEEETPRFTKEVEELKDKDTKKNPLKRKSSRDVKMVAQYVKAILKEAGAPMKTKELIRRLEEANIDMKSPYTLLNQIKSYDPQIQTVSYGYYQYKW